jgi:hypothetical protein
MTLRRGKAALAEIARRARRVDASASSHWREMHEEFSFRDGTMSGLRGFGGALRRRGILHEWAHRLLQRPLRAHGKQFSRFPALDALQSGIALRQGRIYDLEMLRQSLTLACVLEHGTPRDPMLVIGDGYANLTSLLLAALPESRVVLVNLAKTLLVDAVYAGAATPGLEIALATDEESYREAIADPSIRVVAVCADDAELIAGAPLSWAFNVASMQEMDPPVIARYFALMRRAGVSLFYCCNREEKRLPDGTLTRFADYPWSPSDATLLDELCPWQEYYYRLRPPFYFPYDGPVRHRVVRLATA